MNITLKHYYFYINANKHNHRGSMITFYLTLSYKDMATFISFKIGAVFKYYLTDFFFFKTAFAMPINHSNLVLTDAYFPYIFY